MNSGTYSAWGQQAAAEDQSASLRQAPRHAKYPHANTPYDSVDCQRSALELDPWHELQCAKER